MKDILKALSDAEQQVNATEATLSKIRKGQTSLTEQIASKADTIFKKHEKNKQDIFDLKVAFVQAIIPLAQAVQKTSHTRITYTLDCLNRSSVRCHVFNIKESGSLSRQHDSWHTTSIEFMVEYCNIIPLFDLVLANALSIMQKQNAEASKLNEVIDLCKKKLVDCLE